MPYIAKNRRTDVESISELPACSSGELNYQITCLFIRYIEANGESYSSFNDCVGAATLAVAEFQRRVIAPYEDKRAEQNGDIPFYGRNDLLDNEDEL